MLPMAFQPRRPFLPHRHRNVDPVAPPAPPVVHIVNVDRMSQTVLRFTFDTRIVDTGGCGDLRVSDQPPTDRNLVDDYTLDATYPDMVNGNPWSAQVIDGEPVFENDARLADDGGIVPVWA